MNDQKLREKLVSMLRQGNAFTPLPQLLSSMPYKVAGEKPEGFSHTVWELTEHIRRALHDLVAYSKDSYYESPPWPEGYWPDNQAPADEKEWEDSLYQINTLLDEMIALVKDPNVDLFEPFQAHSGHNLVRQATIAAEHTAYHSGQIAMLSKAIERNIG